MKAQTVVKFGIKRAGGDRLSRDGMPITRLRTGHSMVGCSVGRMEYTFEGSQTHATASRRQVVCDLFVLGSGDFHTQAAPRGRTPPAHAVLFHGLKSCDD